MRYIRFTWKRILWIVLFLGMALAFYNALPNPLFSDPNSTVVLSADGELLSAHIAQDEQWRFPESEVLSEKFKKAIITFEDAYFYDHPGVNPVSMLRALKQNIKARKVVSGGSTISMQVIRLSRKNKSRSVKEKLIEVFKVFRLETIYSKDEILNLYASHAPFGGNIVGLEAASWRYYGRSSEMLSWGEAATLAVLPNAPGLIHPGKNRQVLLDKRNRLLLKLLDSNDIDSLTYQLAIEEPLPEKPKPLPDLTPHLVNRLSGESGVERTNIMKSWQQQANYLAEKYHQALSQNQIHNLAILVVEVKTGKVRAYVGNTPCKHEEQGGQVDVIQAPRSTGSILKPLLFAASLDKGIIAPPTILADIPTRITGYSPKNFDKTYRGAVRADDALTQSLNIPAVRLLRKFGLENFHGQLQNLGIKSINRSADNYGLTLILGGGEASLWELVRTYAGLAAEYQINFSNQNEEKTRYDLKITGGSENFESRNVYSNAALWQTFNVLTDVTRPREQEGWKRFASARKIAWKTGTSFGHRDAWAIGITPEYVVGIWAGNANGEGRPGLTGSMVAAPVLFDMFRYLPETSWFEQPEIDLVSIDVCAKSGYRATRNCENIQSILTGEQAYRLNPCSYCIGIHLDKNEQKRVNSNCYPIDEMVQKSWFVLPPAMEWFYRKQNPMYKPLPEMALGCEDDLINSFEIIYPENQSKIFIPRALDGSLGNTVLEAVHRNPDAMIYWHLDGEFIEKTEYFHQLAIVASPGIHQLTLVDDKGNERRLEFEIVD